MQQQLPFHDLQPSALNPRKRARSEQGLADLAQSIATHGVLQNLIVRNTPTGFEIVAGEGRYRGVEKMIADGLVPTDFQLPVKVIDCNDEQAIEIALIENLQREDLHPLDEAEAFAKLYDIKAASGGKKAGAQAVKFLAEKLHRTPRYVQKRIRLARDLLPEWQALLDEGALELSVAQILSTLPAEAQRQELAQVTDQDTGQVDRDQVMRLDRDTFISDWRPMASALFDAKLYKGEIEDVDGAPFATDTKAFDAAQGQAAADLTKDFRAQAKNGDIAFFEEGQHFGAHRFEQIKDGAEIDPAGGVFLERRYDGSVRLYRGLTKTVEAVKAETAEKKTKAKRAAKEKTPAKVAERKPDPRLPQVKAHVEANPAVAMAVELYHSLESFGDHIDWFEAGGAPPRSVTAVQLLTKLNGRSLAKGANLLDWLLAQKLAALAPAWAAMRAGEISVSGDMIEEPSKVEQILFDHAGAKLLDEKAPAEAPAKSKTASKSKPSKKKGKAK